MYMFATLCCLLLFQSARAQTPITISGSDSLCVNTNGTYLVLGNDTLEYTWKINSPIGGWIDTSADTAVIIKWFNHGTTTLTVYGIDTSGDTIETGSLLVTVNPLPTFYVTTSFEVGCQQLAREVTPQPPPIRILTSANGCIQVCEHSPVTYYAHGDPGDTFVWLPVGADSYTDMGDSCIVVWGGTGPGSLDITGTNIYGCVLKRSICFNIIEKPLAIFNTLAEVSSNNNSTTNTINICRNDVVQFIDLSTATPVSPVVSSWWDFGDGSTTTRSSLSTVEHKYTVPGTYIVRLVVANACGCRDTARLTVVVNTDEGVSIDCPSVVCEGAIAKYTLASPVPCISYDWSVQGGTILSPMAYTNQIEIQWDNVDSSGFGYVIYDPVGCPGSCPSKTVIKVPVVMNEGHISGPKTICPNSQFIYRMPQWPTTEFNWNLDAGPTGSYLASTDQPNEIVINTGTKGQIILRVNYQNTLLGCGGVAYDTIDIIDPAQIVGKRTFCYGSTETWSLTLGALGDWRVVYPDGSDITATASNSITAMINQVGQYKIYVTGLFCAPDPILFDVEDPPPTPDFIQGPSEACPDAPFKYYAGTANEYTSFRWSIDTGFSMPSVGDSAYVSFKGAAPWTIKLWRMSNKRPYCTSDTIYKVVNLCNPIFQIEGKDTVCGSTSATYTTNYLEGEEYYWSVLPDTLGSVTTKPMGKTVSVTWNNPVTPPSGLAKLVLRIKKCGNLFYDTLDVLVVSSPTLTLTPSKDTICSGEPITFTVTGSPSIDSFDYSYWTWGDGSTDDTDVVLVKNHIYNTTGVDSIVNFTARVQIDNPNGCLSKPIATVPIWVNPAPVGFITPTGPITHCPTPWLDNLTTVVTTGFGATSNYTWYKIGSATPVLSGATATTLSVDDATPTLGYGTYTCVVSNTNGCSDSSNFVYIGEDCAKDTCSGTPATVIPTAIATGGLVDCGHIRLVGSWSPSPAGVGSIWHYSNSADSAKIDGDTLDVWFSEAGLYGFSYWVKYITTTGDTCTTKYDTTIIVQYQAGLKYSLSCSGSTYHLTMLDRSTLYPGVAVLTHDFYINGVLRQSGPLMTYDTLVPVGTYYLRHDIYGGSGIICSAYDTVVTPALPVAAFTVPSRYSPSCAGMSVMQFINGSTGHVKSLWDFGDGSTNNMENVDKIYNPIPVITSLTDFKPFLVVYNSAGCTDTARDTVEVMPLVTAGLDGFVIDHAPDGYCMPTNTILYYISTASPPWSHTIDTFTCYTDEGVLLSDHRVWEAGGYILRVYDKYGCWVNSPVYPVVFGQAPKVIISANQDQCINQPFTLDAGGPEDDTSVSHTWQRIPTWTSAKYGNVITDEVSTPGVYKYYCTSLSAYPMGSGLPACYNMDSITITVHGTPGSISASYNVLDCDLYKVKLEAYAPAPGVFNWSNGTTGDTTITYTGGPYRVWYTDTFGCINHEDVYVPKQPQEYLWIFPRGCYDLCLQSAPYVLKGINPDWLSISWDWIKNGSSDVSGYGTVPDYSLNSSGTYNLALGNGSCTDTSETMFVNFIDCPDVNCSNDIDFNVLRVWHYIDPVTFKCTDSIEVNLFNISAPPGASYTLTAKNGLIIPGSGILPPPPVPSKFRFIAKPGFSGSTDTLVLKVTYPDGRVCIVTRIITFSVPPCDNSLAKRTDDGREATIVSNEIARLLIAPNPAQDLASVEYTFTGKANQRSIELFDMTGRRIISENVIEPDGKAILHLENLSNGIYQVILRQDGKVFLHSKLSIAK